MVVGIALAILGGAAACWLWLAGSPPAGPTPAGPTPSAPAAVTLANEPAWFRDMTAGSGLHFTYRNGEEAGRFSILESLGGGVALLDYDGDGRLDIFVPGGGDFGSDGKSLRGHPGKLYKNLGGWKFQDVTAAAGLGDVAWWYTHGAAVADYDRDGFPDLLVTGYGRLALFHNEPDGHGGRRFVDVTKKMDLHDGSWSSSAGWADLDGDGFPDLYVCHYVDWSLDNDPPCKAQKPGVARDYCPPQQFKPLVHALFHNEGGKAFRDVSAAHGFKAVGDGLGVVLVDVNDDGRPDVYVADDASNNLLFINRGAGKLEEKAMRAGVAVSDTGHYMGSMGVDAGDYDGSGRPSLWVTNFQGDIHALYRNLGGERFHHQSRAAGVAVIGQHYVGFGTAFVDVDSDGWEDLVIVNGHVVKYPILGSTFKQRPVLLRNVAYEGRRFFKDASAQAGPFFRIPALGRGLAVGDLDNDGRPDLVACHTNAPVTLLRNEAGGVSPPPWLGVRLVGRKHRDVVGSTVVLEVDGRKLTRFAKGGGSYLSASDPRILFGLGEATGPVRLTVRWSWGRTQTWHGLATGRYWELHEDRKEPVLAKAPSNSPEGR